MAPHRPGWQFPVTGQQGRCTASPSPNTWESQSGHLGGLWLGRDGFGHMRCTSKHPRTQTCFPIKETVCLDANVYVYDVG